MEQFLSLGLEQVPYLLKRSLRARRLRLTMQPEGILVVTVPVRVSAEQIGALVAPHAAWILRHYLHQRSRPRHSLPAMGDVSAYNEHKATARVFVDRYLEMLRAKAELPPHRVQIKNHQSRWGSCSRRGGLNFNYRIALLPFELAEYIIIHEACHLFELNHSVRFWNRVAHFIPDHEKRRKQLRSYVWTKS